MIILDINVISEPLRSTPAQKVVDWLDAQVVATLFLTTITLAELRYGIAAMPPGRRRESLQRRVEGDLLDLFVGRILPFDEPASAEYGHLRAATRSAGKAGSDLDAMIAAIARAHGFAVATRDAAPFVAAGVEVISPFG